MIQELENNMYQILNFHSQDIYLKEKFTLINMKNFLSF
jgi:hypothetical protein